MEKYPHFFQTCASYFDISKREDPFSEFLQIGSNGQITLPAQTRRKTKLNESDLLVVIVEENGSIQLVPKVAVDRTLAEKYQMDDVVWAKKQKGKNRCTALLFAIQVLCFI
jgi:AbrB family looped-hinge helix DNA binding protein